MWDGRVYATREDASTAQETYQNDGFEIRVKEDESGFLIYTRRLVKGTAVTVQ